MWSEAHVCSAIEPTCLNLCVCEKCCILSLLGCNAPTAVLHQPSLSLISLYFIPLRPSEQHTTLAPPHICSTPPALIDNQITSLQTCFNPISIPLFQSLYFFLTQIINFSINLQFKSVSLHSWYQTMTFRSLVERKLFPILSNKVKDLRFFYLKL